MALWLRRLSGTVDAVDVEPFASQLAGDGVRAAMLWDRLGCPYQAALALLATKEEAHLRESLTRLVDLGADATARLVRRTMRGPWHPVNSHRCAYRRTDASETLDDA
jgi:hypothetical protein